MTFFFFSLSLRNTHTCTPQGGLLPVGVTSVSSAFRVQFPLSLTSHTRASDAPQNPSRMLSQTQMLGWQGQKTKLTKFFLPHTQQQQYILTQIFCFFFHRDINLGWWVSVNQSFNLQNALWAIQLLRQKNQEKVIRATTRGSLLSVWHFIVFCLEFFFCFYHKISHFQPSRG